MIDKCPSCNVAYRDHLGLHGTCEKLQEALVRIAALENTIKLMEHERSKT